MFGFLLARSGETNSVEKNYCRLEEPGREIVNDEMGSSEHLSNEITRSSQNQKKGMRRRLFRLDCVFYYVKDIDQAIAFYSEILGFTFSSRDLVARFRIDGVLFELVPRKDKKGETGQGNARLCLSVEDISVAVKELRAKEVMVSEVHEVQGGKLATLVDPDENEIALWEYAK